MPTGTGCLFNSFSSKSLSENRAPGTPQLLLGSDTPGTQVQVCIENRSLQEVSVLLHKNTFYFSALHLWCRLHLTDATCVPLFRPGSSAPATRVVRQRGRAVPQLPLCPSRLRRGRFGPSSTFRPSAAPRRPGRAAPTAPPRAQRGAFGVRTSSPAGGARVRRRAEASPRSAAAGRSPRSAAGRGRARGTGSCGAAAPRGGGRAAPQPAAAGAGAVVPRQGRAPPDATPRRRRAAAQVPGGRRRAARARGAGPGSARPFGPSLRARGRRAAGRGRAFRTAGAAGGAARPGRARRASAPSREAAVRGEAAAGRSGRSELSPGGSCGPGRTGHGASQGRRRAACPGAGPPWAEAAGGSAPSCRCRECGLGAPLCRFLGRVYGPRRAAGTVRPSERPGLRPLPTIVPGRFGPRAEVAARGCSSEPA